MKNPIESRAIAPGVYAVTGYQYGYFLSEHDEPLPVRVQMGRCRVPESCYFHGNPDAIFTEVQIEAERHSLAPSLIDPDMPRPLTPEQMQMHQMQMRLAQMEIAVRRREVITPRQIEAEISAETEIAQGDPVEEGGTVETEDE